MTPGRPRLNSNDTRKTTSSTRSLWLLFLVAAGLVLVSTVSFGQGTAGINYQVHRASVDAAKGIRQFQKADNELFNDSVDSAVQHYDKGLDYLASALEHLEKAEDKAYAGAESELDKGNAELQKCIEQYEGGDLDKAEKHYDKALQHYDTMLELLGE